MFGYLRGIYQSRLFCYSLVQHDIRKRYRRSALGVLWAVIQPVMLALVLTFILHRAFQHAAVDYFLYVLTGLCFWNYITHVVSGGCQSIQGATVYILENRIPIAVYPLRYMLVGVFHLVMAMLPVAVLSVIISGLPTLAGVISLIPVALLLLVLGWSLSCFFGIAAVYVPDVSQITQVALRILFYATPIIWQKNMARFKEIEWVVSLNPLAAMMDLVRGPLLNGLPADNFASLYGLSSLLVVASFAAACGLLFWCENRLVLRL
ncbi:Teichoic acid translocation permease protein TagG [Symmachiella macrocystis]|uniref:Transport permease protein n=1 Tax=Symmachiella macrocystis TaxID=2527985 RepID=A0A5C6BQA5_9PLAN|nr:ABC transporter permease [Symmachiella macrocystis]TWU13406.1 Teichoic acid translocation permease protein TagG [Symmachiella macrocystis]